MNTDLILYYKERAREYEQVYQKPERQEELQQITKLLQDIFTDKTVFEVACGTGYWTKRIAETAHYILATDINEAVLEVAQAKDYPNGNVNYKQADLFALKQQAKYESLFGGFILSHIKLQELPQFINIVNASVNPGGTVVLVDNNYVEGSNTPASHQDEQGNTYQHRTLSDGSTHQVLKNYFTEDQLHELVKDSATDIRFINLTYYWILTYKTPDKV
ncbi:demethylmenaquinone methyltransferase/2-methoxy-6-polyprenyl-1,4-benzoquinol methylase [Pontibacter aydingkolensis]|uniref:Methyltransferase domain-containing protein n=1 Tax=Pontibacter aydingkolensis TaxID=1911536 RepID=A0ABS7CU05_9BACT|nr:class I SAM-dependent methyltransferase [Pontibacter aydingkolensis]MBW7466977.1 methyltransferase domain-containing protein [Pontibacter aydingkolensis]